MTSIDCIFMYQKLVLVGFFRRLKIIVLRLLLRKKAEKKLLFSVIFRFCAMNIEHCQEFPDIFQTLLQGEIPLKYLLPPQ